MAEAIIIAEESGAAEGLRSALDGNGFTCVLVPYGNGVAAEAAARSPDLALVYVNGRHSVADIAQVVRQLKEEGPLPVMALVAADRLAEIDGRLDVDDFIITPHTGRELVMRAKRLLEKENRAGEGRIKCGSLAIDPSRCEVTLDGEVVELTFREYELLRFLAANKGRVFTREALLDRVWGYDYFGGDRTVDVHVRRLRSKIERHGAYIETVRNIGYRFRG